MQNSKDVSPNNSKADTESLETPDLYLSSFLMARGIPLKGSRRDKGRTFFIFPNSEELQALIQEYYADAPVGVISYKSRLRELKILVHYDARHLQEKEGTSAEIKKR